MLSARKIQYFARRINGKFIWREVKQEMPGKKKQRGSIPVMDSGQYRRTRRLVHECCNISRRHIYLHGLHLCPQFAQRFTVFPEPTKPVRRENPLCPAVMFVEPHLGHFTVLAACARLFSCCCTWVLNWDIFVSYSMMLSCWSFIIASSNSLLQFEASLIQRKSSVGIDISLNSP